jgi:hypothetical protein
MSDLCRLIWSAVVGLFRSRAALQAEILFLRHQLNVLQRRSPKRVALSNIDRLVFAGLYCLAPQVLDALKNPQAGNSEPLASGRLPSLLAMEIETARWATEDAA